MKEHIKNSKSDNSMFNLDRFLSAQDNFNTYETALNEVKNGSKQTHWIWFVFPQIKGLGHSATSQKYSIQSLLEAKAYLENDTLSNRLYEITRALMDQEDSARTIFGGLDALKVRSCMTLFDIVSPDELFSEVLEKFFDKTRCNGTLGIVQKELEYYKAESAFKRNGINAPEKAFLESGSDESNQFSVTEKIGTLLELFSRGEKMTSIVSRYLWHKDFSIYRVSGVEATIRLYFGSLANVIYNKCTNEDLIKEASSVENSFYEDDTNVFTLAEAFDSFYKKYATNSEMAEVIAQFVRDSKCLPLETEGKKYYHNIERPVNTPEKLSLLKDDEIFVFGSNLAGSHGGGAARAAFMRFGAIMGQGVGLQGQSYAIPTMQGGVETIKPYVDEFISFAQAHSEFFFFVTRIGCGIAGFKDRDIAPLFAEAMKLDNICLPESFIQVIAPSVLKAPTSYRLMQIGQCRTLADIVKTLNTQNHYSSFENLMDDFGAVIDNYKSKRGYDNESIELVEKTLQDNKHLLMNDGRFDVDKFEKMLSKHFDAGKLSDLDVLYIRRMCAKIIILARTLNDICQYKDFEDLRYDLLCLATGRMNCGDSSYMSDPYLTIGNFPINWFISGLHHLWKEITTDGVLDNELMEKRMFTEHQGKLAARGIDEVIKEDYEAQGVCHPEVFYPIVPGTGPVYVKGKTSRKYLKACGEGKGPRSGHEIYDMEVVSGILNREIRKGEYILVDDRYYIPTRNLRKPVFARYFGRMHFHSFSEKKAFIEKVDRR